MNDENILSEIKRECGDCHRCCEGWLTGSAYGFDFNQGRPCHFLNVETHCTIYDKRPYSPCQTFTCEWLTNPLIPEWLKPNKANVIVTGRALRQHLYWDIVECGTKIDSAVLNWFFLFCVMNGINIVYRINGSINYLGTAEFTEEYNAIITSSITSVVEASSSKDV